MKRKRTDDIGGDGKKCNRPLQFRVNTEDTNLTKEDFEEHKSNLLKEWAKPVKSKKKIVQLMKETAGMRRRDNSRKYKERLLFNISRDYNFLKSGEYVSLINESRSINNTKKYILGALKKTVKIRQEKSKKFRDRLLFSVTKLYSFLKHGEYVSLIY
jgi:hypothetical protein